jgi:hypothetical protein
MAKFLLQILDWSEAWATLLPIIVFLVKKPRQPYIIPIVVYLAIALLLNTFIDISWKFYLEAPRYLPENNNFLYNIQSVCRLILFLWFFNSLGFNPFKIKNFYIEFIYVILISVNFIFLQSFKNFSNNLFSLEAILLLLYSLKYLLYLIKSDEENAAFNPSLFIVTGIAVYEAVNFPIFLFHDALTKQNPVFSAAIWKVHDYVFIILCLFFSRAFYGERKTIAKFILT